MSRKTQQPPPGVAGDELDVDFVFDPDAEPGDVLDPLAELLVRLARQDLERRPLNAA